MSIVATLRNFSSIQTTSHRTILQTIFEATKAASASHFLRRRARDPALYRLLPAALEAGLGQQEPQPEVDGQLPVVEDRAGEDREGPTCGLAQVPPHAGPGATEGRETAVPAYRAFGGDQCVQQLGLTDGHGLGMRLGEPPGQVLLDEDLGRCLPKGQRKIRVPSLYVVILARPTCRRDLACYILGFAINTLQTRHENV